VARLAVFRQASITAYVAGQAVLRYGLAQILRLYDLLESLQPSPIVSLNRAVASHVPDRGPWL